VGKQEDTKDENSIPNHDVLLLEWTELAAALPDKIKNRTGVQVLINRTLLHLATEYPDIAEETPEGQAVLKDVKKLKIAGMH
jgi:hypothetical protein